MKAIAYERRMKNLLFTLLFFLGLTCLLGFSQLAIENIKNSGKIVRVEVTIDPVIEEQLLVPVKIKRLHLLKIKG